MIANANSAIPPMIATRTASCGVSVGRRSLSRYIPARPRSPRRPSGPASRGGRRRRRSSSGSTASDGRSSLRQPVKIGSASSAFSSTVRIMSRITSGLTRAPMSSISETAAKATTQAAVASVPTASGISPWLGSRTSRKRPTP